MKTAVDSIGRRDRFKRSPKKTKHYLTQRDLDWLSFLHRHGGRLPTSYIFNSTKDSHPSFQAAQVRLKHLFQEMKLLDRPWQQEETIDPRYNEIVHQISNKGLGVLKDENLFSPFAPTMNGAFKHQVMLSCISASFELNSRGTNVEFIPQHDVLTNDLAPEVDGTLIKPDEVFMLKIGNKKILCFVEADRGTEATSSYDLNRKSWRRSISEYQKLIGHGLYKEHYGINCGALLFVVTISQAKQDGILEIIEEKFPKGCSFILVNNFPEFGRFFRPPSVLNMLGTLWERSKNKAFKFV